MNYYSKKGLDEKRKKWYSNNGTILTYVVRERNVRIAKHLHSTSEINPILHIKDRNALFVTAIMNNYINIISTIYDLFVEKFKIKFGNLK